jgi:cytidylate kinase
MKPSKSNLQIAIDGPLAAGKSIVANQLAKKLGVLYVYTGAMYRAVAWIGIQNQVDLANETALVELLPQYPMNLSPSEDAKHKCRITVAGKDVSDELFTPKVSNGSSVVAQHPQVRAFLVQKQQEIAQNEAVVMEGRDIATRVLPNADLKIYMDADLTVRAQRRYEEFIHQGHSISFETVKRETKERDDRDLQRSTDPLQKLPDSWILDTTKMGIPEVIQTICDELKQRKLIYED